ncbi:MAG TPA: trypsin-like peptidase domain-containing protein [Candidatus Limnocylindria bacterium]|nr:trypsin-like peptidase domain-containing protein [Candidatus Limnocylindria bacterium]
MTTKKILASIIILAGVFLAGSVVSQTIKLNPIKPGTQKLAPITDEQQAILAVRTAKASVVSIVGVPPPATTTPSSNGFSVTSRLVSVSGTGFILDADGTIVTNNHVIDHPGLNFSVVLFDGTEYPAIITGKDTFDDIAVLKIEAHNLTPAKLGDSDALETGQSVFAIGNSLGRYESTVTRGVVSGVGRAVDSTGNQNTPIQHNWIQTDAAINPGNSGGPLINLSGEVIGMNTLIDTSGEGLGFAIPSNAIKEALGQLKTFGKVSRPFLGVQMAAIDPQLQLEKNLPVSQGGLIVAVLDDSAAARAGIRANDIVTAVNGKKLDQRYRLDAAIQKFQAGNQITLTILRGSQTLQIVVILGMQQ